MAERPDCARMDQLIPELAIGVAAGDERARILGHLARCVRCRSVLESASAAATRCSWSRPSANRLPAS